MTHAAIYTRVSTDEQAARGFSLPEQVTACQRYAAERGYQVVGTFQDDYTGMSMDRPALDELRVVVKQHKIKVIIVSELDRLARKAIYQMLLEEEFAKLGARVEYVYEHYEDTDEGRLQKHIKAGVAEYERAKILARAKRGKIGKARRGYVVLSKHAPYGYRKVGETHEAKLEPDKAEARVVRMIFEWYVYGDEENGPLSGAMITTRLTLMSVPTRGDANPDLQKKRGAGVWERSTVYLILSNETYIGRWRYGKTGSGELIVVSVPALIDDDTFALAQERRARSRHQMRRTKRNYLLRGRLRCGACGHTFVGKSNHERALYVCRWKNNYRPILCNAPSISANRIEILIWDWVSELIRNPEHVLKTLNGRQAEAERQNAPLRERLALVEQQIEEHDRQLRKLLDLYLLENFPAELLTERKSRLENTRRDLERERAALVKLLDNRVYEREQFDSAIAICRRLASRIEQATPENKGQIFEMLDVQVTLSVEDGMRVAHASCALGEKSIPINLIEGNSGDGTERNPGGSREGTVPRRRRSEPGRGRYNRSEAGGDYRHRHG